MPIYVVICPSQDLGKSLNDKIVTDYTENDRHEISPGVWFIRSPFVTTEQVRDKLNIEVGGNSGIVIAAARYTGIADRALVEKLQVWEGTE